MQFLWQFFLESWNIPAEFSLLSEVSGAVVHQFAWFVNEGRLGGPTPEKMRAMSLGGPWLYRTIISVSMSIIIGSISSFHQRSIKSAFVLPPFLQVCLLLTWDSEPQCLAHLTKAFFCACSAFCCFLSHMDPNEDKTFTAFCGGVPGFERRS